MCLMVFWVFFGVGSFLIWTNIDPLVIFSIFGFLGAVLLSSKDWLSNFTGYLLRVYKHHFTLGDRIEINGVRGVVMEVGFLTTTLQKIQKGRPNGTLITIPNGWFWMYALYNESMMNHFLFDEMHFKLAIDDDWKRAKQMLLELILKHSASFLDQAKRQLREERKMNKRVLYDLDPKVWIESSLDGKIEIFSRFCVPVHLKEVFRQELLEAFLEAFYQKPVPTFA